MDGLMLGMTIGSTVSIDINGAGHGWFVDLTADDDEEFRQLLEPGALAAIPARRPRLTQFLMV